MDLQHSSLMEWIQLMTGMYLQDELSGTSYHITRNITVHHFKLLKLDECNSCNTLSIWIRN